MMAKNLVTLAIYNTNTVLEVCNLCDGLRKDQIKLKYLQDLFFMRRLMLVQQLAKWGAPESPLAFTIPFQSNNLVEAASVRTQVFLLSITRVVLCRWQYIHVLYTLILYFRYSNFEIDITTMHFNFLTLQC